MSASFGTDKRKLQTKLQMIANGSSEVNGMRADKCAALQVTETNPCANMKARYEASAMPVSRAALPETTTRGKLEKLADDVLVNVFVETDVAEQASKVPQQTAHRANLATATVTLSDLKRLVDNGTITYIEMGETLAAPTPVISPAAVDAPSPKLRQFGDAARHRYGEGVLIGIIDVQGFDFAHEDFLDDNGETRFVRIWDQGGDHGTLGAMEKKFGYGVEFTQERLNEAIRAAPEALAPPQALEPQSQMVAASHGTHVASIAAGKLGICRKALIAGVLLDLPKEDTDRRRSFYDSTRLAHAVDYLIDLAGCLGMPVSINVSLGTNGHAHDASEAVSRWIDAALSLPGRSICVAAGNAGQEEAAFAGDTGYVPGRIHSGGRVAGRGLAADLEWLVLGNGRVDVSENELEVWYSAQDRFEVSVRPPNGEWIGPVKPRQFIENREQPDGSFVSIYNELYHPANGGNHISVYLSPFFSPEGNVGVPAGRWTVRLHGQEVRDGCYHAWIERDDPQPIRRDGPQELWSLPSFFSERSNVDTSSVSSLACGQRIVSVANLDLDSERISISSSQGPTRDGRSKPDVAAPGTGIIAAKGFAGPDDLWVRMSGTSMACPYVAGVAGLMLAIEPRLTAAQIGGIMQGTARPLPGADYNWLNDAGFGQINPQACLDEASVVYERNDRTAEEICGAKSRGDDA